MYGSITREQLVHVLRSDIPGTCMPLIDERLASLHTAGTTLCQVWGAFLNISYISLNYHCKAWFLSITVMRQRDSLKSCGLISVKFGEWACHGSGNYLLLCLGWSPKLGFHLLLDFLLLYTKPEVRKISS